MDISSDGRYFMNRFPDGEAPDPSELVASLESAVQQIGDLLLTHATSEEDEDGRGIYSGRLGIIYAFFLRRDPIWQQLVPNSGLKHLRKDGVTLLNCDILDCVLRGDKDCLVEYANRAAKLDKHACEVFSGRAGCISALLLANRLHPDIHLDNELSVLVEQIVREGLAHGGPTFMWIWHGKEYLGAIHGTAGILYVLMRFLKDNRELADPALYERIVETVDWILRTYSLPTGNIQSSTRNHSDQLVHFCHGATGWIPVLCLLAEENPEGPHKTYASRLGGVVWERGLLATKGPGLCHGISGSICGLIDLFRSTRDRVWLQRAGWFARFLANQWRVIAVKADRPYSLFEGLAGAYLALSIVLEETRLCSNEAAIRSDMKPYMSSFPGF